ncbi:760_t:CDS:2 [Funneliformis geosporum]|nr:760_t:CDS:2 [Funneliformis geosporum]
MSSENSLNLGEPLEHINNRSASGSGSESNDNDENDSIPKHLHDINNPLLQSPIPIIQNIPQGHNRRTSQSDRVYQQIRQRQVSTNQISIRPYMPAVCLRQVRIRQLSAIGSNLMQPPSQQQQTAIVPTVCDLPDLINAQKFDDIFPKNSYDFGGNDMFGNF